MIKPESERLETKNQILLLIHFFAVTQAHGAELWVKAVDAELWMTYVRG